MRRIEAMATSEDGGVKAWVGEGRFVLVVTGEDGQFLSGQDDECSATGYVAGELFLSSMQHCRIGRVGGAWQLQSAFLGYAVQFPS